MATRSGDTPSGAAPRETRVRAETSSVPPLPAARDRSRPAVTPMYFSLRALAVYSGLCNRTLREYIHDRVHPLPHFRIGGKILVKRDDFDHWAMQFRRVTSAIDVGAIVDDVLRDLR